MASRCCASMAMLSVFVGDTIFKEKDSCIQTGMGLVGMNRGLLWNI